MNKLIRKNLSKPSFSEEKKLWKKGFRFVLGLDEVGRGAFAGPIVAAAVIFDNKTPCSRSLLDEVNDSKLLKSSKREKLYKEIIKQSLCFSITEVNVATINKVGIGKANKIVFRKTVNDIIKKLEDINLSKKINLCAMIDGFHVGYLRGIGLKNQKAIIKGDRKCLSIAAASIIAKVHRDRIMRKLSKKYHQYGFGRNKGYGTKEHQLAIQKYGLSKIHRTSFNLSYLTS